MIQHHEKFNPLSSYGMIVSDTEAPITDDLARLIGTNRTANPTLFGEALAIISTRLCPAGLYWATDNSHLQGIHRLGRQKSLHDLAMHNLTLASNHCIVSRLGDTLPGCSVLAPQGDR